MTADEINVLINTLKNSETANSINPIGLGKILAELLTFVITKGNDIDEGMAEPTAELGTNKKFYYCSTNGVFYVKLNGNWLPLVGGGGGSGVVISQQMGNSQSAIMSQNAVTNELKTLIDGIAGIVLDLDPLTATFTTGRYVFPKGSSTNITMNWTYKDGKIITGQTVNNVAVGVEVRTFTESNITTDTIYNLVASTDDESITKTIQILFKQPFYFGKSATSLVTSADIIAMGVNASDALNIDNLSGQVLSWDFTNSRMVLAIPATRLIAGVLDPNSLVITSNFIKSVMAINGVDYNLYVFDHLTNCKGSYKIILQ